MSERTYQPLWNTIKELKKVQIQIQPSNLTDKQAEKYYKTLRKAISKEKWLDVEFKRKFPRAVLTSSRDKLVVMFMLDCNYCNPLTDF